ncbi:hypothetical protein ACFE04_006973 [Oxalis oulophora]
MSARERAFNIQAVAFARRRELATSLETRTKFPELVTHEEKRVRFTVINSLEIVEKPNNMPLEDVEWFKRLTGRTVIAVHAREYKHYSPRHKFRRAGTISISGTQVKSYDDKQKMHEVIICKLYYGYVESYDAATKKHKDYLAASSTTEQVYSAIIDHTIAEKERSPAVVARCVTFETLPFKIQAQEEPPASTFRPRAHPLFQYRHYSLMEGELVGPFNLGNPGEFTMLELAQACRCDE